MQSILETSKKIEYKKRVKDNCIFEDNYVKIPLFDKQKNILDYTFIDKDDFEKIIKISLCLTKNNNYKCVSILSNENERMNLSHYILQKPKKGFVIDHINRDALDNRKLNLHEIPINQNNQNKTKTKKNTSSKYIGVCFIKTKKNWAARCGTKSLGYYKTEIDAAIMYDKYTYVLYGEHASNNRLIKFEDTSNLTLDDFQSKKIIKNLDKDGNELPMHITFVKDKYKIQLTYKKKRFYSIHSSIKEAILQLDIYKKEIKEMEEKEEKENIQKQILRNDEGFAIINIYNEKKKIVAVSIVDDNKWHELSKFKWYLGNNYAQAYIKRKKQFMHRYLMDAKINEIIDHNNNNSLDNRISNLRPATPAQNNYNKSKSENTSSIYKGVIYDKVNNKYKSVIQKNNKKYNLGTYDTEIVAAIAYNLKAVELFEKFANLNTINLDIEKYNQYKNDILKKWEIKNEKFKGVILRPFGNYLASAKINKIYYYLGTYDTEIEAAIAYNIAITIVIGEEKKAKNRLNIIDIEIYNKYKNQMYDKIKSMIEKKLANT
jgi:hypothetical protein